jgi:hypothetical protein
VRAALTFDATDNQSLSEIARPGFIELSVWPRRNMCVAVNPSWQNPSSSINRVGTCRRRSRVTGLKSFDPIAVIDEYHARQS